MARRKTSAKANPVQRVREICLALPECEEKVFGGHTNPTFRVRDKIFVMIAGEAQDEMWCKAAPGAQDVLIGADPKRFFKPPYVGPKGWVGIRLNVDPIWGQIVDLVYDSYRMTAPKRLSAQLPTPSPSPLEVR
jgi:hypothetical protein